MNTLIKNIKFWLPPSQIRYIYFTISISEFATGLATPLLTFLFFSTDSSLFPRDLSMAQRGVIFGLFIGIYRLAGLFSNPVFGFLSDLFGRKKIILIAIVGIFIFGICSILALIFHSVWVFAIGACIFSFLWSLRPVSAAAINDVTDNRHKIKNLAFMQFFIGIGAGLGPILGGYLGLFKPMGYHYMLPFILVVIFSVFLFIYTNCSFKETLSASNRFTSPKELFLPSNIQTLFSNKTLYFLMLINILDQFSWGAYYNFMPPITKIVFNYGISSVGLFIGLIGIWLIVSTGVLIPFLQRYFNNTQLIIVSSLIGTVGVIINYAATFFPDQILAHYLIWICAFPIAAGDVILFCLLVSLFSSYVSKQYQGTIVGIVYIVGMAMWCLAAPIGGYLMKWRHNGAMVLCPIAMISLLIFLAFSLKKEWFKSLNKMN